MKKNAKHDHEVKVGGKNFQKKFNKICRTKNKEKRKQKKKGEIPIFIKFGFWILLILLIVQICFYTMKYILNSTTILHDVVCVNSYWISCCI